MSSLGRVAAIGLSFLVADCAIHPLPEDVTGVSTYHIVRQIRCETRDTVRKMVIKWLGRLDDPYLQNLAAQYESDPASIRTFSPAIFKGPALARVRQLAELFYDTGVAYNFDFTITEDNNLTADVGFAQPFPLSNFTLGVNAGANRTRTNERVFTLTDTFSYLLTKVPEEYCQGFIVDAHYIYPITGRIGVDRLTSDFVDLTLFGALAGTKDKPDGPPTMLDTLTFTTVLTASVNPKIEFTPINPSLHLASASFKALADRSDMHVVTVALAIATSAQHVDLDPVRAGLFAGAKRSLVVGRRVTGGGTSSEKLAVAAIDQFKAREFQLTPAR